MAGKEIVIHYRGNIGDQFRSAVRHGQEIIINDEGPLVGQKLRKRHHKPAPVPTSDPDSIDPWTVEGLTEAADLIVKELGGDVTIVIKGSGGTVSLAGENGQTLNRTTIRFELLEKGDASDSSPNK